MNRLIVEAPIQKSRCEVEPRTHDRASLLTSDDRRTTIDLRLYSGFALMKLLTLGND